MVAKTIFTKKAPGVNSGKLRVKKQPRALSATNRVAGVKVCSSDDWRMRVTEWIRHELGVITKDNFAQFISLDYLTHDSGMPIDVIEGANQLLEEGTRGMISICDPLKFVDARFEDLSTAKDVYIKKLPPDNDPNLHVCNSHLCVIPDDNDLALESKLKVIYVPQHWRRSIEGVLRNFYGDGMQELLGHPAIADVTIQIKTDLATGNQNLVLNYRNIRPASSEIAKRSMKIGAPQGQILIPGTKNKFIHVDWLKKPVRKQKISETSAAEC